MSLQRSGSTLGWATHPASTARSSSLCARLVWLRVRRESFDVLISDLGLPDGNGFDLLRELLKVRPIPGIALSGYGMESDIERSREAGFVEHLIKPINIARLEEKLREILA